MTVFEARRWIIVASLVIAGAAFSFFVIAPVLGYPLRFSQAVSILQIVFPVFLGYLGAATQFVFQKSPPPEDTIQTRPLMGLLIHGPIGLFVLIMVVVTSVFGYSNRASAGPGDGIGVDQLRTLITAALGLLAVTTNVVVAYLFSVQGKAERKPPKKA
jgi:hypothetical protein